MTLANVVHFLHDEGFAWIAQGYHAASNTNAPAVNSRPGRLWRIGVQMKSAGQLLPRRVQYLHENFIIDDRFVTVAASTGVVTWDTTLSET